MKNIVLIEDDEPIRDIFRILFMNSDYRVTAYENGDQITSGQVESPDLFILDRQISGTNGLDLCRFIKRNKKYNKVPVIMLSASPDIEEMALEAGADDAISKPFSLKKLRDIIARFIGK